MSGVCLKQIVSPGPPAAPVNAFSSTYQGAPAKDTGGKSLEQETYITTIIISITIVIIIITTTFIFILILQLRQDTS